VTGDVRRFVAALFYSLMPHASHDITVHRVPTVDHIKGCKAVHVTGLGDQAVAMT
jgi:hypothetical protein